MGLSKLLVAMTFLSLSLLLIVNPLNSAYAYSTIATIPVGAQPWDVAINPSTNMIYVTNANSNSVSVINGATNTVTATIPVDSLPYFVAVNPSTNTIYVNDFYSNSISVINGATNTVTATISVGSEPYGVAVNPSTNTVYVANYDSSSISVINGATNTITATISVGSGPYDVVVNPSTNAIYVSDVGTNSVSVINGATNTVTATIPVGSGTNLLAVNPSTNTIYISNDVNVVTNDPPSGPPPVTPPPTPRSISIINGATNTVTSTIPLANEPVFLAVNPSTNTIFAVENQAIDVINGATNTVTTTVPVGFPPFGIAVNPSNNILYVDDYNNNELDVIGTPIPSITASFDQPSYFVGHAGTLTVIDSSAGTSSITATVSSTSYPAGIQVILNQDAMDHTKYVSTNYIQFTSGSTSQPTSALHVSAGDTVIATYSTATPATATISQDTSSVPVVGRAFNTIAGYSCNNNDALDKDGICNNWEDQSKVNGLSIPYSGGTYNYACFPGAPLVPVDPNNPIDPTCPDPNIQDVYVEVDWMTGHKPDTQAIQDVINAFANYGINLHVQLGEDIGFHKDAITVSDTAGTSDFDQIKSTHFGTPAERERPDAAAYLSAKAQVFHYALFIHSQMGNLDSSGWAELPGNDFIISLGSFTGGVGSRDQQEGTFMHELGHNLGLHHGGVTTNIDANGYANGSPDSNNCKPNYLSVMSYSRQFSDLISNRPLDYSESALNDLNEDKGLNENTGIIQSTPSGLVTVYGPTPRQSATLSNAQNPIDWDRDVNHDTTGTNIKSDVNNLGFTGCNDDDGNPQFNTLVGRNDWANLVYNFRNIPTFADGIHTSQAALPEITSDIVKQIQTSRIAALDTAIQNLPNTVFSGDATAAKANYHAQLLAIDGYIQQDNLAIAVSSLQQIRNTMDSSVGGVSSDDIITSASAQSQILPMLDDIISSFTKQSQPAPGTLHPTPGHVTGAGDLSTDNHIDIETKSDDGKKFTGHLDYDDKSSKVDLDSQSITYMSVDGSKATISGTGKLNNKPGYSFTVYVEDNGNGKTDYVSIKIYDKTGTVYTKQDLLEHGNVVIHNAG